MLINRTRRMPFRWLMCSEYACGTASMARERAIVAALRLLSNVNLLAGECNFWDLQLREGSLAVWLNRKDRLLRRIHKRGEKRIYAMLTVSSNLRNTSPL